MSGIPVSGAGELVLKVDDLGQTTRFVADLDGAVAGLWPFDVGSHLGQVA